MIERLEASNRGSDCFVHDTLRGGKLGPNPTTGGARSAANGRFV